MLEEIKQKALKYAGKVNYIVAVIMLVIGRVDLACFLMLLQIAENTTKE